MSLIPTDRSSAPKSPGVVSNLTSMVLAFVIGLAVLGVQMQLLNQDRNRHVLEQQRDALNMAYTVAHQILERLNGAMSATYALATVLRQHNYQPDYKWMEPFARELLRYHPGTSNLQFTPGGITKFIVPLAGNEKAIGNNLLVREDRNKEALLALESRKLTLAGPFELRQGGVGLTGRLPIFKGDGKSDDTFWGFAVALVRIEQLLEATDIKRIDREGYDYLLWRTHPDTGEQHVFSKSGPTDLPDGVTQSFEVPNGTWHLTLQPRKGWLLDPDGDPNYRHLLALVIAGLASWLSYRLIRQPDVLRREVGLRTSELAASNARLQDFAETASDWLWESGADLRFTYFSERIAKTLGIDKGALLGKSRREIMDPRDISSKWESHLSDLDQHRPFRDFEYGIVLPSGETREISISGKPIFDADGAFLGYRGVGQDISQRKLAEQAIHKSENLFRNVFHISPIPASITTEVEGRYLLVNDAYSGTFGYSSEAMLGSSSLAIGLWPDPMARKDWVQCIATSGTVNEYPAQLADSTGQLHDVLLYACRLEYAGNACILTMLYDVTARTKAERELRNSELRFHSLFEKSPVALSVTTDDDGFGATRWNQTWLEKFGYPQEVVQGKSGNEIGLWVDPDLHTHYIGTAAAKGDVSNLLAEMRHYDETCRWVTVSGRFLEVVGHRMLVTFYDDITERKLAEDQLRQAASVFEHANEGIIITDAKCNILDINAAFARITGYTRNEVLGKNPRLLSSGRQGPEFYAAMWRALNETGHWSGEIWNRRRDGEVFAELLTMSTIKDENGEVERYVALFSDITTIKQHQQQLEYLAHHDALTNLPNRLLLADRLTQAMSQATRREKRVAVAYLDLDVFKAINDTHGHEVGDQLLLAVARRMSEVLREGDTLARMGGDEFIAVLVDLPDAESSASLLKRLLDAAALPLMLGTLELQVSASIGVSFYPQEEEIDADQLIRQADQAMYLAKQSGRNRFHFFDADQDRRVRGHHESLQNIRQALQNREFVLYYQPKVDMREGVVLGAEALIRWQHPERGLLPPALFLPVIENNPLSIDIGEWVIDTALTQIENWHAEGLCIPVSVNVGVQQLQYPDFVLNLRELMARHPDVKPGELELEILETSALEDFAGVSEVMRACLEMGVGFAVDDFGTGYSSLAYLKRLSAPVLKIDQGFVRGMIDEPDDLAILEGILGLATAFRRQVIAEGVETVAHGEMLLRMNCSWGQGYAIARPMAAQDMSRWAMTWEAPPHWKTIAPLPQNRLPVLVAAVSHQVWIKAMVGYLSGVSEIPPELSSHHCRFGEWLDLGGRELLFGEITNHPIDRLHEEVHRLGTELVALRQEGSREEAATRSSELLVLRDQLLEQLSDFY